MLPFKSSLLEPAAQTNHPLTVARLDYPQENSGDYSKVSYWGDDVFFPHLLNLLSQDQVRATVRFAPVEHRSPDRKGLARQLHAQVLELKS